MDVRIALPEPLSCGLPLSSVDSVRERRYTMKAYATFRRHPYGQVVPRTNEDRAYPLWRFHNQG